MKPKEGAMHMNEHAAHAPSHLDIALRTSTPKPKHDASYPHTQT